MRLSKNFTLEEVTKSNLAYRLGIPNNPDSAQFKNLERLVTDILQPIRDRYKNPIIVSSGFRCPKLNKAVGGVANSDHCKGLAVDIHSVQDTAFANRELFWLIESMIADGSIIVRQLIDEHNYNWIHISCPALENETKFNEIIHI